jgi:hypothetical protein
MTITITIIIIVIVAAAAAVMVVVVGSQLDWNLLHCFTQELLIKKRH